MSITKKDVEHILKLARIELTESELVKYEKELSAVLEFVEKLNKVDTENVKPLTGGTDLMGVTREDEINQQLTTDNKQPELAAKLVKAAPEYKDGWIKVKAVFE